MDYLDDNLAQEDRARFERHLNECPPCTEHVKQIRLIVGVTGQLRDEDLDPLALEDLMGLYRRWRGDQHA
jgi:anti-sigma factor RsiW